MAQPQSQGEVWGAEPRPVCQGGDDQAGGVPQVLVGVQELSVTDVGVAVVRPGVPAVPELGLPGKRLRVLHLRSSWLGRAVSRWDSDTPLPWAVCHLPAQ